jgi:serine/threonine-protein kinase
VTVTCPHCHADTSPDARFCGTCGQSTIVELIGRTIAGRYRMLAKLGEGGMGAVYRAEQISLKRTVAVKLLRPEMSSSPLLLRRFNAEAEVVAKLSHPNTVNIYDFGQDTDGTLFIAMEFIEGTSLRSVLHAEGALPLHRALAIGAQVAASLADAHTHGIVHRDLKPDNVMLQTRGKQRDVVRVLDFGIAKLRDENRATQQAMTQQGDMLGTPQYMAPEQIRADQIDGRTDVYALACMIYELATGRMPFEAPTLMALLSKHLVELPLPPSQRRPDLPLPPALDALVLAGMAKDAAARPATMELFGEQIAALQATLPAAPATPSASQSVPAPIVPTPAAYSAVPLSAPLVSHGPPAAPHGTPVPHSHEPVTAPPRSRRGLVVGLGIVGVIAIGGGIVAALSRTTPTKAPVPVDAPAADPWKNPSDPWNAHHQPGPDPWATTPPPPKADAGGYDFDSVGDRLVTSPRGFSLNMPQGFTETIGDDGTIYATNNNGVVLVVAAVDPQQAEAAVQKHVADTSLPVIGRRMIPVNGVQRPLILFGRNANAERGDVEVAEASVGFFTGRVTYAVTMHLEGHAVSDPLSQALFRDLIEKRVKP